MAEQLFWISIIGIVAVTLLWAMWRGWQARKKNTEHLDRYEMPAKDTEPLLSQPVKYVATSESNKPLERINSHGLGFRGEATLDFYDDMFVFQIAGEEPFPIPRHKIKEIFRATWTIDRVVEPGGLIVVKWVWDNLLLDSYFRCDTAEKTEQLLEDFEQLRTGITS